MKCSKCGYDYPARETKCPYCGEPNKLGMEWEKEEDETRKETLLTKAKVLHSMPLYVANKIMNIILLLAVVLLVVLFLVFFILGYVDEKHTEHQKRSASVEAAEEIFKTDDYRISEIEFQENQKYFSEIQQNTIATLMGAFEMTEKEVQDFVECDHYYDEEETFVKMIFERKGWEYEEN